MCFGYKIGILGGTFECKVESLSGEVADDIHHVPTPEGEKALLVVNTGEAVNHSLVPLVSGYALVGILGTGRLDCGIF